MKNLLWELQALADSDKYPFHMPGHKRNLAGFWEADSRPEDKYPESKSSPLKILAQAARLDITEIDDFDNLHAPEGILKEALQRAAALYGADETFYSVNGSTAGLLTAISAAAPEGSQILMARNCHKAVYHALYLRRLKPVYLYPEVIGELTIADALKPEAIQRALDENPDIKTVILTSPTYDGICADIKAIADIVHEHNGILIVDAAHGAHFGFHPGFPESPVRLGADLTVVSLHKTLPAMTQTALLHVTGNRVDRERLRMFSGMYQTSSPSYFFMAGMDTCMRLIEECGAALWDPFWQDRADFLKKIQNLQNLRVFTAGQEPQGAAGRKSQQINGQKPLGTTDILMDAGKILIETGKTGLTGQQLYDILLKKYHLQLEMAAGDYATAIVTCCDRREGWERMAEAILAIDADCSLQAAAQSAGEADAESASLKAAVQRTGEPDVEAKAQTVHRPYPKLEAGLSLTDALDGKKEHCPLREAKGRIAGNFINLYPPGIPLAVPGEVLSAEVIEMIEAYAEANLPLQGVSDGCIMVTLYL